MRSRASAWRSCCSSPPGSCSPGWPRSVRSPHWARSAACCSPRPSASSASRSPPPPASGGRRSGSRSRRPAASLRWRVWPPARAPVRRGGGPAPPRPLRSVSADAEQVLHGELVEPLERQPALAERLRVELLGAQLVERLALAQRRDGELGHPRGLERLRNLRVGPEGLHLVPQDQVVAHAGAGGLPDALDVLGARRLVVEVQVAVVGAAAARAQQRVDRPEGAAQVARPEAQVLVEARPVLAVEVDVEE